MKLILTPNQKIAVVIIGVVIAILLLVKIIGWNRVTSVFSSKKTEQIRLLKNKISVDSLKIISLQNYLAQQKDSVDRYVKLYDQAKDNYKVITKYYEKKIEQVRGLDNLQTIEYFLERTNCEDTRDTNVIIRLSNIVCANINFANEEMFLAQRDSLQVMNITLETGIDFYVNMTVTQQELIDTQKGSLNDFSNIVTTQDALVKDLEKAKKKVDRKIKRVKTLAIITGSAAVVLGAILILQ